MERWLWIFGFAALFGGCGQQNDTQIAADRSSEWVSLFNGRDYSGWKIPISATCEVVDGEMVLRGKEGRFAPEERWIYTERSFGNFILKLQYYCNAGGNSGVALRYPGRENPAYSGYEVQIEHTKTMNPIGSIYNVSRPYATVDGEPVAQDEQWNTLEIRCVGDEITTMVNGHQVAYGRDRRSLRGTIGLQIHDAHAVLRFKDIQFRELPDVILEPPIEEFSQNAPGEFVPLYNGTDLSGWVTYLGGDWQADGAAITGTIDEGTGWLVTENNYSDFILSLDVKVSTGGNSGILIRFPLPENPGQRTQEEALVENNRCLQPAYAGHEVQVWDNPAPDCPNPSGSIYDVGRAYGHTYKSNRPIFRTGEWNHYVIYARGAQLRTYLNGQKVAEALSDRELSGSVGLQVQVLQEEKDKAGVEHVPYRVWFKNIKIKRVGVNPFRPVTETQGGTVAGGASETDLIGVWNTISQYQGSEYPNDFEFAKEGDLLVGYFVKPASKETVSNLSFADGKLTFEFNHPEAGEMKFDGTISAGKMKGDMTGFFGVADLMGRKQ